jgi:hypothetical protein
MKYRNHISTILILVSITFSCKQFVEIEPPKNTVVPKAAFENNDLATSVVLGIYQQMALTSSHASGGNRSISTICGVTADEFVGYDTFQKPLYDNQISPQNPTPLWTALYKQIYNANATLEGLETGAITPLVNAQLQGESYFIRAFHYFYLVNLFGAVPLILDTDYKSNTKVFRKSEAEIYIQIIKDLRIAETLLSDNYIAIERIRPNKSTVQALLARTYLYLGDWENAEKYASFVIEKSSIYKLVALDKIFLSNSLETIWQLQPPASTNTAAGNLLIFTTTPTQVSLRPDFVLNSFETNDQRKTTWIKSLLSAGVTYYYPFKYRIQSSSVVSEYLTVFRLAELFLIRAEARTYLNNLPGAITDLDAIRERAGLILIKNNNPGIGKEELITAIQRERKVELFTEWGDRWFNLKRTGKLNAVLLPLKPSWKSHLVYFPIPESDIALNRNLVQNEDYNK